MQVPQDAQQEYAEDDGIKFGVRVESMKQGRAHCRGQKADRDKENGHSEQIGRRTCHGVSFLMLFWQAVCGR
ncbi:hypothetical protein AA12467_1856 [Gluconobacter sphaericus NBRC 12467]|nr:hypothetical protein AA12467_1856 [Gluconobacter sphaericus NBRC 12467]